MSISTVNALPDIVSVQKRVYPLILTAVVSEQPTSQPLATAFGLTRTADTDDGSGWSSFNFRFDRWYTQVESTKLKSEISTELLQDMRAMGLDESVIEENLADEIADEVNKKILRSLDLISDSGTGITISAALDKFNQGRNLYTEVHARVAQLERDTGCTGTYVVAGGEAFDLLSGSSLAKKEEGTNHWRMKSGLILVHDKYSAINYINVGVKKVYNDFEISSLVFSTYDYMGATSAGVQAPLAYNVIGQDPNSLHPIYGVIARYAITAAPIDAPAGGQGVQEIDWTAFDATKFQSKLSVKSTVTIA
ncbi:major head protein [Vibrio phage D479]